MSNGLLYIAGLFSLALAALFAVPYFVDWNGYRGVFEEEATRILGREVRVGGDVNVRFLPSPYVSFEKLRIADPTGSTGEPFFRAESFTMRLSAPPLLKGVIEANEIVLEKPFVRLAVDANGEGNWSSFSIAPGSLPFVPAGVTLQSVKINDGTIALHGPKGIGFAEVGGLNGELKAESIEGPFSFKGVAVWDDGARDVRIATGAADADGSIRFKATVRGTGAGANLYAIDGRLQDAKGKPRVDGEITAKLTLPADEAALTSAPAVPGAKAEAPLVDFKARIDGNSEGLRVDDIALSFEHIGQPQLIAGSATATWTDALKIDMGLSSRWLDLDRVAKPSAAGAPFETARNFILAMMEALPKNADSRVAFDLDQATLGGEAVSDIKLEVMRNGGVLGVSNLRAGMPGGARIALDGAVDAAGAKGQAFRGDLTLYGTSLARFLNWAVKDKAVAEVVRNEGPFSLQGDFAMSENAIDLTDAGAEIGGRAMTGAVHYSKKERPRFELALEGVEMDAGELWPAGIAGLKRVLAGGEADAAPEKPKFAWLDPAATDVQLRLRAGSLLAGKDRLRDVDMDIGINGGRLDVRRAAFASDNDLNVEIDGSVAETMKDPRGSLHWTIAAPSKEAFATLVALFDLDDQTRRQADALSALTPLRLAGSVELGRRLPQSADVSIDGSVQSGGRLVMSALLDGGLDGWRAAPADITATVNSADVGAAWEAMSGRPSIVRSKVTPIAGEMFFKAVGTGLSGMTATASVKAPNLFLGYDGRVTLPADGQRGLDGELRVAANGLADVMEVAGLGGGASLEQIAVNGSMRVVSSDHTFELHPERLTLGGSKVSGAVALSYPSEGSAIVTGAIDVDQATIPGLLAFVLDRQQVADAPGAEPLATGKTIWPEHAFDFGALDGIEGKLNVTFGSLVLTEKMAVAKAKAEVELAPGKIAINNLAGKVLGGDMAANVALDRAPGGASLKANVRMSDMQVRAVQPGQAADSVKDQKASLALEFSGHASTPGALVSVVSGKGELQLGDIAVAAPTPLAVVTTSEAVLSGDAGGSGEALATALRSQIDANKVKIGPRTVSIDIADGAAKLALVTLESDAGKTKVETTVDLASLVVDSAWVVEPRGPDVAQAEKPRHGALPSVGVVYTGALANLWTLDQRITVEPLERELAIRKMELDADQLERLHKADAERAQRDEERRKALESDESIPAPPGPTPAEGGLMPSDPPAAAGPTDPTSQQSSGSVTPAIPPSSASAAGLSVPPAPGQEGQTFGAAQAANPALDAPTEAGSIPPAAEPVPAYRPRRVQPQRQVRPNEQVLRNLMNTN